MTHQPLSTALEIAVCAYRTLQRDALALIDCSTDDLQTLVHSYDTSRNHYNDAIAKLVSLYDDIAPICKYQSMQTIRTHVQHLTIAARVQYLAENELI